jgi:hypothetical protein
MVRLSAKAFQLVKAGNLEAEYEDALAVNLERACFAVADGATESAFAGLWAEIVTRGFVEAPPRQPAWEWLSARRAEWQRAVPWDSLPWYGRAKANMGAGCALLGLWFDTEHGQELAAWRAVAIGDCCLFQVRAGSLLRAFPLSQSAHFGNRPRLLGSVPAQPVRLPRGLKGLRGHCQSGDAFVLATDALAQCCLAAVEAGQPPWPALGALQTQDQFAECINGLRAQSRLRNDDVTLVLLAVEEP